MMTIPDYQSVMLPLLEFAADGKMHSRRESIEYVSKKFGLTQEEKEEFLSSGRRPIIDNRVDWAKTYLKKAGLLEYPRRGYLKITDKGLQVLKDKPEKIDNRYLNRFPEFVEFKQISIKEGEAELEGEEEKTPIELIEEGHQRIRRDLGHDLLENIQKSSPEFFERLVIELLVRMGYGGSMKDPGKAIGRVGDEGIDGVIKEDMLGLDNIYVQAKRWKNPVGRPVLQSFVGALHGKKSRKGIFITTSSFGKEAIEFVKSIESKVALIDGRTLVQ